MPLERYDVQHPLWRKKVDGSLLRLGVTPIPGWVAKMWEITRAFPGKGGRKSAESRVSVHFEGAHFDGAVTSYSRKGGLSAYRLWLDEELRGALAETFVMSNMRDIEARLRVADGDSADVEHEIPFWEFLDIEFNISKRAFDLSAYYVHRPSFPSLFKRMSEAPPLKRIRDELAGKAVERIYKQPWKSRSQYETELGASNVIYMLVDTTAQQIYVGEAEQLVARIKRGHDVIPAWDYYRYDMLPAALAPHRLQIERMVIRDLDGLFGRFAAALPVQLSTFRLVNAKIDR